MLESGTVDLLREAGVALSMERLTGDLAHHRR
ncbi:hypothetical protein, partial [Klebsiella pneumoniae]